MAVPPSSIYIFPVLAQVDSLFSSPTRKKGFKWTNILRTNDEIWFTDRFRLLHVHGSACLRELVMGTAEYNHLAEIQKPGLF